MEGQAAMSRSSLLLALLIVMGVISLGAAAYLLVEGKQAPEKMVESVPTATVAPIMVSNATATAEPPSPTTTSVTKATLSIVIRDGESVNTVTTSAVTVRELLAEAGIVLNESDALAPSPETSLVPDMEVRITRAIPLTIVADGQSQEVQSSARTPEVALAHAGVAVGELDIVKPAPGSLLNAGDVVQVVRVREESLVVDEEVPYQTVYQPSDRLDLDTKAVISGGVPGIKRQSTVIRYEDGVEIGREVQGEWMEQEPVNEVIGYGTRITTNVIDTPEGPREYWRVVHMRVTAYTAASSGKPPDHPAYGITASGLPAGTGIVAVDANVIPFRSEVFVPGYGVGFAGDTGGGVKGRWIDLGYDEDELVAWNGYTDVYYLTPIPEEINYLIPDVLP
jgi:3D (Asp-Asp-Asp) domain-containing protein